MGLASSLATFSQYWRNSQGKKGIGVGGMGDTNVQQLGHSVNDISLSQIFGRYVFMAATFA
jgi:hypothetical protein